jgi:hypothetical protein
LPRDRAGHGIKTLLQNGNPGVKPVAIAVERLDRRGQTPGFALAFPRRDLCLSQEIGGRGLLAPQTDRGLIDDKGNDDGADRDHRPGSEPPEGSAIEFILVGEKSGKCAAGRVNVKATPQPVRTLRHEMSSAPLKAFTESTREH